MRDPGLAPYAYTLVTSQMWRIDNIFSYRSFHRQRSVTPLYHVISVKDETRGIVV